MDLERDCAGFAIEGKDRFPFSVTELEDVFRISEDPSSSQSCHEENISNRKSPPFVSLGLSSGGPTRSRAGAYIPRLLLPELGTGRGQAKA
jgi:hypothetical protein